MIARVFLPGLVGLLLALPVPADELTVIPLSYRSADEMVAIVQPLLQGDERVSGLQYQLILNASPERTRELRRIVSQFDLRQETLLISVEQRQTTRGGDQNARAAARLDVGGDGERLELGAQIAQHNRNEADRLAQQLRIVDGGVGFLQTGSSRPVRERLVYPDGRVEQLSRFDSAQSGFYVRPRLNGDTVTLDISVNRESIDRRGSIAGQQAVTTVSGRLGEWITLGGVSQQRSQSGSGLLSGDRHADELDGSIRLKVERAGNQ